MLFGVSWRPATGTGPPDRTLAHVAKRGLRTVLAGRVWSAWWALVPWYRGAAAADAASVSRLGRGEADAYLVELERDARRDRGTRIACGTGDCHDDDLADGLGAGLGVVGGGGLNVPPALAAGADVLLIAAELELRALAISKTVWNVAVMSMVSVPGIEASVENWPST